VTPAGRAARLVRWYPRSWRDRYGEEFAELLIADIEERPRSRARTADVIRGGIAARLAGAGLCGFAADAAGQVRASLVSLACCLSIFLGFGAAIWSQLTIGWQWSESSGGAATAATIVTSAAMLAFLVLALLAAAPVVWVAGRRIVRGRGRNLLVPAAVVLAGAAVTFAGGRHFGNGWPGTGAHRGFVPGGLAAFSWASTLSVSSYWAHPTALAAFPAGELAWMAVSPLAVVCAVAGAAAMVRRADLPRAVLRYEIRLAAAACAAMPALLAGCCWWIAGGGGTPLFHAGAIDVLAVIVMAGALVAGQRAARQARLRLASIHR
jgi:hypothetical protein